MSTSRSGALLVAAVGGMLLALAGLWVVSARQASAQEIQCIRPTQGLVSLWKGEGDANDSVGSNHGTVEGGATFAQGISGQAFSLNGISGYINVPDNGGLDFDYITVAMWIKPTPSGNEYLFDKRNPSRFNTDEYGMFFRASGTAQGGVHLRAGPGEFAFPYRGNQWNHYAMTWDGSILRHYLNGVIVASASGSGTIIKNAQPLRFGTRSDLSAEKFGGLMDEVSVYGRGLSQEEIQNLYCDGTPPSDNDPPPDNTAPEKPTVDLGGSNTDNNVTNDDTPTFSGTAEAGGTVQIYDGNTLLGEAPVSEEGNWSFTVPPDKALTDGPHQITVSVTDGAGNTSPLSDPVKITVDTKNPIVECATADALWHKEDVSIACTASDDGSGLVDAADESFSLSTNVANGTETNNAQTASRQVCDKANNCATAGPIAGNKVDKKAPSIAITTPPDGAEYKVGQAVASEYSCSDGGSGLASCSGLVPSGTNIDTATVGSKSFAVEATDEAGNTASKSNAYSVVYDFGAGSGGFLPPIANYPDFNEMKAGATAPVKFSLGRDYGLEIFASGYPLSRKISCDTQATVEPVEELVTASNSGLKYDATTEQYSYNWKTERAWSGTCRQLVLKLNDGTEHPVNFSFN